MAIDTQSMLLKLNPMSGIDLSSVGRMSIERQRLALMREELEETKRRHEADERLRQQAELGEMARANMAAERERANREAQAQAAMLQQRQEGGLKFAEKAGSGDQEAAEAMIPYLESLGSGVDITRNPNGLPSYRYHQDAAFNRAQQQLLDEEAWRTQRGVDRDVYGENPVYAPPPDPKAEQVGGLIDLQQLQEQRLQRLSPTLQGIVDAHPDPYKPIAESARLGIEKAGLPVDKALQEYRAQLSGPIELTKAQLETRSKDDKLEAPGLMDREKLKGMGFTRSKEAAGKYQVDDLIERRRSIALSRDVLANKEGSDDYMAGPSIARMMGERGATTQRDVENVLGDAASGFITRINNGLYKQAFDGLSPRQKNALLGILNKSEEEDKRRAFDFLKNQDEAAASAQENVAEGMREYRMGVIPSDWRDEYEAQKKGKKKGSAPTEERRGASFDPEDVEDELMLQATDAGLDWEQIRPLVRTESGGDPGAKNKMGSSAAGLFQFTDETAQAFGLKDADEYAALPVSEQVRLGIERFKQLGLKESSTADDYAMANAAPGYIGASDSTPIKEYASGTEYGDLVRKQNPGWVPKGGGEITVGSIKAFYRRHRGEKPAEEEKPETDASRRARELIEKARR